MRWAVLSRTEGVACAASNGPPHFHNNLEVSLHKQQRDPGSLLSVASVVACLQTQDLPYKIEDPSGSLPVGHLINDGSALHLDKYPGEWCSRMTPPCIHELAWATPTRP